MTPLRTVELDVRERDKRRVYLEQNAFELSIAVLAVVAGLSFFLDPATLARSPIGQAAHPFDTLWNLLYIAGGAFTAAGLARPSFRLEVAGLLFLSSAIAASLVALMALAGTSIIAAAASSSSVVIAALIRIRSIRRLEAAIAAADLELERHAGGVERRKRRR